MKKFLYLMVLAVSFSSCTDDFEEANTNPYQISDEDLRQDNNHLGAFYGTMLYEIFGQQIDHNLTSTSYSQQLAQPTVFVNNVNNTTYFITWNDYWNREYNNVMVPALQVSKLAMAEDKPVFAEWAHLIQLVSMSRLTTYYGPVIYSHYGEEGTVLYDSEPELYAAFFSDLDRIIEFFKENESYDGLKAFDKTYGGVLSKWAKFANSLRLRLAIRISKVAPDLAKAEGEKALADTAGLISTNAENMNVFLNGQKFHPAVICFDWGDTRMSATMESILVGYRDNRIDAYFDPVSPSLVPDHPAYPYKGIRNGAKLEAKEDHINFSTIDKNTFNDPAIVTSRKLMSADEVYFLKAEAALRGWAGAGDAQINYETGVRTSFDLWGVGGADEYLADDTSLPIDYNDPFYSDDTNDFTNQITSTVAWDESATNEEKLEKIITQKWIASFTNDMEAWVDFRRTGYPKLPPVYQNSSSPTWGIIPQGEFIKRMPFPTVEREGNPQGVADATAKLGGPDEINTRLWWDTGGPNFP